MRWTILEAVLRTAHRIPQKLAGLSGAALGHAFLTTLVVGIVQTVLGVTYAILKGTQLVAPHDQILGSMLFGVFAVVALTLGTFSFQLGGDVGTVTFIVTLSIIPGALLDRFYFKHRLSPRQWLGIMTAILAGYSVLGWPSLTELLELPTWVFLALGVMLSVALNQAITQKVKEVDPMIKNFWGGVATIICCVIGLGLNNALELLADFSNEMTALWVWSAVLGCVIVGIWVTNLMSYKGGAGIAIKKLVMNGTYLTLAMLMGVVVFDEALTPGKVTGVFLYFIGFALMDKNTWQWLKKLATRRQ
jgi:drug/metabolite transporter (DMT)-like permease